MKIYTVATSDHIVSGHGESYNQLSISPEGSYGCGTFPPCFKTKEEATEHMKKTNRYSSAVVELELK